VVELVRGTAAQCVLLGSGPILDGLNLGLSTHWYSGVPKNAYGYSFAYANWEYYLVPRGSVGRHPSAASGRHASPAPSGKLAPQSGEIRDRPRFPVAACFASIEQGLVNRR